MRDWCGKPTDPILFWGEDLEQKARPFLGHAQMIVMHF